VATACIAASSFMSIDERWFPTGLRSETRIGVVGTGARNTTAQVFASRTSQNL
jgi:hypothetical protein